MLFLQKSLRFIIKSDFKSRAGYNGAWTVIENSVRLSNAVLFISVAWFIFEIIMGVTRSLLLKPFCYIHVCMDFYQKIKGMCFVFPEKFWSGCKEGHYLLWFISVVWLYINCIFYSFLRLNWCVQQFVFSKRNLLLTDIGKILLLDSCGLQMNGRF